MILFRPLSTQFCVNSLRDECREFFANYGRDGRDLRAQARFPCYYSQVRTEFYRVLPSFFSDLDITRTSDRLLDSARYEWTSDEFLFFFSELQEKNDSVVTKFSRSAAVIEFALTAAVPGGLFIFSCSCLVLCTKVQKDAVGVKEKNGPQRQRYVPRRWWPSVRTRTCG